MTLPLKKSDKEYTYADYLKWDDNQRWEIISSIAYNMTPSPSWMHQDISRNLLRIFANFLFGKDCKVYGAPFDVILQEENKNEEEAKNVVQPDIFVVCDTSKLSKRGCNGAPDLIIEIVSPSSAARDAKEKFDLYERFGVKEYWLVFPKEEIVQIFKLGKDKKYGRPEVYTKEDTIKVGLFDGELEIDLSLVFEELEEED
jgi:Uma2 family endonuclease